MPRPQKSNYYRRSKRVEIRLTEAEEQSLIGLAADCGLSVSDHIRKAVLGGRPRRQKATPERAAFIKGLAELGKIGGNINQIAKALNTELVTRQKMTVSGDLINASLYALQTLSKNLLKHLTDGHQG
ncbi:plasmid mobilization relaxosome protein MobC [Nostoc ellipsosporum NOK]|nr:plasmid mobilization relaxosome protein MobC [Nostoc ellipsosporum NOK]